MSGTLDLSYYYDYQQMISWYKSLEIRYGKEVVRVEPAGRSYQGREIHKVTLCGDSTTKPVAVWDAGIHSR